jgi:hypothetical protein
MFRPHVIWSSLQPRRSRHPIVSALLGLFAVCAFLCVLAVGAVIAVFAMLVGTLLRAFGATRPVASSTNAGPSSPPPREAPSASHGDVIDGEFSVVEKTIQHPGR